MKIDVNGTTIFYEMMGNGPPLLLLHGNGEDHHIFDELAVKLRDHFTVYAIDSRNHGQSEKSEDFSYQTMTGDVYCLIEALALKKVKIIGFSDGAILALLLALDHPEVLEKMALLGINLSPKDFTEESYRFIRETFEETKDPLFKMMMEQPNITLNEVRCVNIPTLVIAGEDDIFRPDTFPALADALPDAELKIMSGHGHDTYIANRDILYPDLLVFFAREG